MSIEVYTITKCERCKLEDKRLGNLNYPPTLWGNVTISVNVSSKGENWPNSGSKYTRLLCPDCIVVIKTALEVTK